MFLGGQPEATTARCGAGCLQTGGLASPTRPDVYLGSKVKHVQIEIPLATLSSKYVVSLDKATDL